jgi:hypothetical protein
MKPSSAHSFPDAEVLDWKLASDRLELGVSDVFFEGQSRGPAKLVFPLLRPASSMSYDHDSKKWVSEVKVERLKDLCEFHLKKEEHYSLKGFGRESGRWLAVGILSREAQITW